MSFAKFLALVIVCLACTSLIGCKTASTGHATHKAPYNSEVRWRCLYCDMEYYRPGECCGGKVLVPVGGERQD